MIEDDKKRYIEEIYGRPYNEVREIARNNLIKAGCPENKIDFVLDYGGIHSAYENDLDCFEKFPEHAVMYLTTD